MRVLFVAGVLGLGTALVFAAAALTANLFPNGTVVNAGWNGPWGGKGGIAVPMPAPMVMPAGPDVVVNSVGVDLPMPTD